ncbi:Helisoma trivolvis GTP-binding protein Go alpha subunit, partial [Biomphalaria glabrata]
TAATSRETRTHILFESWLFYAKQDADIFSRSEAVESATEDLVISRVVCIGSYCFSIRRHCGYTHRGSTSHGANIELDFEEQGAGASYRSVGWSIHSHGVYIKCRGKGCDGEEQSHRKKFKGRWHASSKGY